MGSDLLSAVPLVNQRLGWKILLNKMAFIKDVLVRSVACLENGMAFLGIKCMREYTDACLLWKQYLEMFQRKWYYVWGCFILLLWWK